MKILDHYIYAKGSDGDYYRFKVSYQTPHIPTTQSLRSGFRETPDFKTVEERVEALALAHICRAGANFRTCTITQDGAIYVDREGNKSTTRDDLLLDPALVANNTSAPTAAKFTHIIEKNHSTTTHQLFTQFATPLIPSISHSAFELRQTADKQSTPDSSSTASQKKGSQRRRPLPVATRKLSSESSARSDASTPSSGIPFTPEPSAPNSPLSSQPPSPSTPSAAPSETLSPKNTVRKKGGELEKLTGEFHELLPQDPGGKFPEPSQSPPHSQRTPPAVTLAQKAEELEELRQSFMNNLTPP